MGHPSEVYCDPRHLAADLADEVRDVNGWRVTAGTDAAAILHYSIESPAFTHVVEHCSACAIHYHNITPADLLWTFNPNLAAQCREGRARLVAFAPRVIGAAADSAFNAEEMDALGFPPVAVIGVLRPDGGPTPARTRHPGPPRILFVGRGVPNKAQHSCILVVAALGQVGVEVRLRLVGSWGGSPAYTAYCHVLARDLRVADQVEFLGSVSDADLAHEYATADAFLCLSEHEGFCVPIVEALEAGIPVVAFRAGAVAETLGHAGIVLDDKSPSLVAEALLGVLSGDIGVPESARREQISHHSAERTTARLQDFIRTLA